MAHNEMKKMKNDNFPRLMTGIAVILIGLLMLFNMFGWINVDVWPLIKTYWPILVILLGLSIIARSRFLFASIVILLVLVGGSAVINHMTTDSAEERTFVQESVLEPDVASASLTLSYGAGNIKISEGDMGSLIINEVTTSDMHDPTFIVENLDGKATINLDRQGNPGWNRDGSGWSFYDDSWDIGLSEEIPYSINMNYGAATTELDLEYLNVDSLEIESGATTSTIRFGEYPTDAKIHTGASTFVLQVPESYGARIKLAGGITNSVVSGFEESDVEGVYMNEAYDPDGENIEVVIDAGASTIKIEGY